MEIIVELYGIPRDRAGTSQLAMPIDSLQGSNEPPTLGKLLQWLGQQCPGLEPECLCRGQLTATCSANLEGDRFITDPTTPLAPGQTVLLLSADAGG